MLTPIILKLSGEIFLKNNKLSIDLANSIAKQIEQLQAKFYFGIVIGGGNFFRGAKDSQSLELSPPYGHYVGMLATQMNSLILKNCFYKNGLKCKVLSALPSPAICTTLSQNEIVNALNSNSIIIFAGGNGTPFFSTDTTAVVRALQLGAKEIWKGTKEKGVFDKNPRFADAKFMDKITFQEALDKKLGIMDLTAFTLAQENNLTIQVFDIFEENALLKVAQNRNFEINKFGTNTFGTTVYKG